jgi:transposase
VSAITLQWPAAQSTLQDVKGAIDALVHRREGLEREILVLLPTASWTVQAGGLTCLRGVDTLTAVGLCVEVGDFKRFAKAGQLMSYIWLTLSENTTGEQRRTGSITKTAAHLPADNHYGALPKLAGSRRQCGQRAQGPATNAAAFHPATPRLFGPFR